MTDPQAPVLPVERVVEPKQGRPKGYIPNRPDQLESMRSAHALLGAPGRLGSGVNMDDLIVIEDQSISSACVPETFANLIRARLLRMGFPASNVPFFSVLAMYAYALMVDRVTKDESLEDNGCRPMSCVEGMRRFGVPPSSVLPWPDNSKRLFELLNPIREPDFDVDEAASAFTITGEYTIDAHGSQRSEQLAHALEQGYPFGFALNKVTAEFENLAGTEPVTPTILDGAFLGRHMMGCATFEMLSTGKRVFHPFSSWGTEFGDRGFFNATEDFMNDPRVGDIVVITLGPVAARKEKGA